MREAFGEMGKGLILAMVLVYLLMATNYQSWLDPFLIMMALPGALRRRALDLVDYAHDAQRRIADGRDHGRSVSPPLTVIC